MNTPIKLKAANIKCVADESDAKERPVKFKGRDYLVLAHDDASAYHAARMHHQGINPMSDRFQEELPL